MIRWESVFFPELMFHRQNHSVPGLPQKIPANIRCPGIIYNHQLVSLCPGALILLQFARDISGLGVRPEDRFPIPRIEIPYTILSQIPYIIPGFGIPRAILQRANQLPFYPVNQFSLSQLGNSKGPKTQFRLQLKPF